MLEKLFKTAFQRHVEKKAKVENEIKVLQNQQKVKSENVITEYESKQTQYKNNIAAQIAALRNQIKNLDVAKDAQIQAYDKERVVALKKVDNYFDAKILSKKNEVKKLTNLIEKERKDMQDFIEIEKSNAPKDNRKILNESK